MSFVVKGNHAHAQYSQDLDFLILPKLNVVMGSGYV